MYDEDDKFKCLTQSSYNTNFSDVCVKLKFLDEIFKKLSDNDQVILYTYLTDEDLKISITSQGVLDEISLSTDEIDYQNLDMDYMDHSICNVLMKTSKFNETIKKFSKFGDNIQLICTKKSFIFQTPKMVNSSLQRRTVFTNVQNNFDENKADCVQIQFNDDVNDNIIIQSTYVRDFLKVINKVDDKCIQSMNIYFIKTQYPDNYFLLLAFTISQNEYIKIIFVPKNIEQNNEN